MGSGTNGIPGAATVVPFTNRTSAPCGPRRPAFFNWRDFKDWVVSVLGSHTVELSAKADKVPDGIAGNLAGIGAGGNLVDSGLRADGFQPLLVFDTTPTAGSLNPVTSGGIKQAIDAATPSDYDQVRSQVSQNAFDIDAIEGKIPSQASAQNQLADKDFVNSSIATNTATFRGTYNLVTDLGLTTSATHEQVAAAVKTKLAALSITPDHNDYCFVQVPRTDAEPTVIARIDRYKCSVEDGVASWDYEWSLNNSSFTANQWAAINSGITSALVEKLGALPTAQELAAALAGKASTADATLTPIYSDTPTFSEWTGTVLAAENIEVTGLPWYQPQDDKHTESSGWYLPTSHQDVHFGVYDKDAVSLSINGHVDDWYLNYTATRTRTDITGYTLGSQSDKPLQPKGEYALLSEVYAAVQQIAPAWVSGTVYAQKALVSYNGVVYRYKVNTVLPSTVTPDMDTTRWEAKKISELFLPLTGGTMTGSPILDGCSLGVKSGASSMARPSTTFYGSNRIVINNEDGMAATVLSLPHSSNIDSFRFYTLATLEDIAPQFSESATYAAGDMCVYGNRLYRCTTAVTTAGAWNASNWTTKKVSELFLPLTGGAMTGPIAFANDLYELQSPPEMSLMYANDGWNFVDHMGNIIRTQPYVSGVIALLSNTMRFSAEGSYDVDDVVFHDGSFYRCTTAHTAGAWNASHFAEVIGNLSTGMPTAPTPASGDNSTKVATTAFVQAAVAGGGGGTPLSGQTFNFATTQGVMDALKTVIETLGGTVTNAPTTTISQGE